MRIRLSSSSLKIIRNRLRDTTTITQAASRLSVSTRTLQDWCKGKFTIPEQSFNVLTEILGIEQDILSFEPVDEKQQKSRAGILGGKAQWQKNGKIGTLEDKRKGGHASFSKRGADPADIFAKNVITKPSLDATLSEFMGILIGDGSLTKYQMSIVLNMTDDREYVDYVCALAEELFHIQASRYQRYKSNCTVINISSIELVTLLVSLGLPQGDKIRSKLDIPKWIKKDLALAKTCLRGIFDTDGSIFLETHTINGRKYPYPRIAIVSASEKLRVSLHELLRQLGFNPKIRMNRSVNLERFTDIEKYFRIIGSSNVKHLERYAAFGGVG